MFESTLTNLIPEAELEALHRPTGEALGLPGHAYGEEFYRLEQHKLFPRTWCPVGFASDIPEAGDAVPVELAGWPLILLRDKAGEIRAFHNICRHRAMRVLPEPCKGRTTLSCPWHGWIYDLSGQLVATPRIGGERVNKDSAFKTDGVGLKPVGVGRWLDLIFVNIDGEAPPFEEHIQPLTALFDDFDLSTLRRGESWQLDYPGNWKVSVEGALENYHLAFGHPQLVEGAADWNERAAWSGRCYMAITSSRAHKKTSEQAETASALPAIPLRRSTDEEVSYFMNIFPTGGLTTRADHYVLGLLLPDGPNRTIVHMIQYYVGDAATDPAFKETRDALVADWKIVFEQDIPFVRYVHENYKVRDASGISTRFTPRWEGSVHHFQKTVVEVLND